MATKKKISDKPGNPIYKYRTKAKMTQQQVADLVGVTVSFMINLENGKHNINFLLGMRLCRVLGMTPNELEKFLVKSITNPKAA